jgi:hypothetical protein
LSLALSPSFSFKHILQQFFHLLIDQPIKMRPTILFFSFAFLLTQPTPTTAGPVYARAQNLTIAQLEYIAPTSTTCNGAPFPEECAVAAQALPYIVESFQRYCVSSPAEQAALISLMAFESADFKYNQNHYPAPGRPGQGSASCLFLFSVFFPWGIN